MSDFVSKLWKWLINRSPKNATTPDVQSGPAGGAANSAQLPGAQPVETDAVNSAQPYWGHRIETNIETQFILGLLLRMASIDSMSRTPDGELVSEHNDETVVLLGCGHLGTLRRRKDKKNDKIKNIDGQCRYCAAKLQEELSSLTSAAIDPRTLLYKELKTLVCEECGKITTSNHLACPDHYAKLSAPDGTAIYLNQEDAKEIKRRDTIRTALSIVNFLFGEDQPQISDKQEKEQRNAPNPISIHLGHIIHYDRPPDPRNDQESATD